MIFFVFRTSYSEEWEKEKWEKRWFVREEVCTEYKPLQEDSNRRVSQVTLQKNELQEEKKKMEEEIELLTQRNAELQVHHLS